MERGALAIRPATPADDAALWSVLEPIIRAGDVYPYDPAWSRDESLLAWRGASEVFVAVENGAVVGTYYLRPNQAGGGAHVANGGYATAPAAQGRGIARALCAHSLERARERGFRAVQFNFVVSTNERAVRLWQSFGFEIVGRLPGAFRHPQQGLVDVFVMYLTL